MGEGGERAEIDEPQAAVAVAQNAGLIFGFARVRHYIDAEFVLYVNGLWYNHYLRPRRLLGRERRDAAPRWCLPWVGRMS